MNYRNILIFTAGLALLVIAIFSFSDDILSPYVPFREAKSAPANYVQIIGRLDKSVPITHTGRANSPSRPSIKTGQR